MRKRRQDVPAEIAFSTEEERDSVVDKSHEAMAAAAFDQDEDDEHQSSKVMMNEGRNRPMTTTTRIWLISLIGGTIFLAWVLASMALLEPRVHFACPKRVAKSANDIPTENVEYERVTNQIKTNMTHFIQTFRNSSFDAWGRTYDRVKEGMYHWKSTRFAPNLNSGDSIYESACGIGMNLFMTLEIMNEVKGIESLVVYGNEYVSISAEVANAVYDSNPPFKAIKGTICAGDSANIDFVPSNSFDLVYTGYIT